MSSPRFPEPPPAMPATPLPEADAAIASLLAQTQRWVDVGIARRIELLRACIESTVQAGPDWVAAACKAKGIDPASQTAGQEWLGGPMTVVRNLRLFAEALEQGGQPRIPGQHVRPDGQVVLDVFPANLIDKLLYTGYRAEIWIEQDKAPTQGRIYREKVAGRKTQGGVGLVLGAGNVSSIGAMDALYKLFVDDEVVLLKTNPVNDYMGPIYERALAPLVAEGVFRVVHGGGDVGRHLCQHPDVHSIHITGSDRTHDVIVWGPDGDEAARRKAANSPVIDKPITSELGCVTPVMIVPGPWSESDLDYHARQVASMVENNGSFNCNAAKVLVLPKRWALRDNFVQKLHAALAAMPPRKAYYPGAKDRYQSFIDRYPDAIKLGADGAEIVPWTVIPNVPAKQGEYALTNEAFCGVLAEVDLDAADADEYLAKVVPFVNDEVWGTLSAIMIIHPESQRKHAAAFEAAVAELRYGGIAINVWAAVLYGLVVTTWGAYPGHTLQDIRSGRGVVHNGYLVDNPEKSVVYGPFRLNPKPVWFYDHRNLLDTSRRLTHFEANPGLLRVPAVALAALRG